MKRNNLLPLFFFSSDGGAGGGAAPSKGEPVTGNTDPNDAPEGDETEPEPISPNATIQELRSDLDRANKRVTELIGEKRKLQNQKKGLTTDSEALQKYTKLGTPEELETRLKAGDEAISTRQTDAKKGGLAKATEVAGINASALESLSGALDVDYLTEGEGDNAKAFVAFKDADGADQKKDLAEWAKEKYPTFETVLFGGEGAPAPDGKKPAVPFVRSGGAGGGKPGEKTAIQKIRERNQAAGEKTKSLLEIAAQHGMVKS